MFCQARIPQTTNSLSDIKQGSHTLWLMDRCLDTNLIRFIASLRNKNSNMPSVKWREPFETWASWKEERKPKGKSPAFVWLCFRMIPANHKYFLLSDLASSRDYELCVLAVYDDGVTMLTGTKLVGCVSFSTDTEYGRCHSIRDQVSQRVRQTTDPILRHHRVTFCHLVVTL